VSDQTYLFVDGEYLRRIHRDAMQSFFRADGELELSALMRQADATRAYFYDSLDDAPRPGEDEAVRSARIAPLEKFFGQVRDLYGFHVRLGTVSGQGKRRRQKEVDILLAVDMLTHGLNGNMAKAVLLAGDLDFRPIVEALVRGGIFVEVWYHPTSIARDLPGAADFGRPIGFRQLYDWNKKSFQEAHRLPQAHEPAGTPVGDHLRFGKVGTFPAELRMIKNPPAKSSYNLWIEMGRGYTVRIYDEDLKLVEHYVATQYGPIEWEHQAD
jgi:uncharacterized LabA/DUF88 family protein